MEVGISRLETIASELRAWMLAGAPGEKRWTAMSRVLELLKRPVPGASLDLSELNLRSAPPGIDAIDGLTGIRLSGNRLSELELGALPHLQMLALDGNQFTRAPDLSQYPRLRGLTLHGNQLEAVPDVHMLSELRRLELRRNLIAQLPDMHRLDNLRLLDLGSNRLQAMPEASGLPPRLEYLNLNGNQITHVSTRMINTPQMPRHIYLRRNPLSENSITHLHRIASLAPLPLSGSPRRVYFDTNTRARTVLSEHVESWLYRAETLSDTQRETIRQAWVDFSQEYGADSFLQLLRKLTHTAEYQHSGEGARLEFVRRVADVLQALTHDTALRQDCFDAAWEGLGTCGDRAAWTFSKIEIKAAAHGLRDDPKKLFELARGEFRLEVLQQVAQEWLDEFARRGEHVDEIEYMLALPLKLAEALDLPGQPRHMLYPACARISQPQLNQAMRRVLEAEDIDDGEKLIHSVASRPYWRASLEKAAPSCGLRIGQLEKERDRQSEVLEEGAESLTSGVYEQRYKTILSEHTLAIQRVYMEFTRVALGR